MVLACPKGPVGAKGTLMVGRINQTAFAAALLLGGMMGASTGMAHSFVDGPVAYVQIQDDESGYGGAPDYDDSTEAPDDRDYRSAPDYRDRSYRSRPDEQRQPDYRSQPAYRERQTYRGYPDSRDVPSYGASPRDRETPRYRQRRDFGHARQYAEDTASASTGPSITVAKFRSDGLHTSAVIADNLRAFLIDALSRDGRFGVTDEPGNIRIEGTVTRYDAGERAADPRLKQGSIEISLRIVNGTTGWLIGSVQAQGSGTAMSSGMDAVNSAGPPAPLEIYRETALGRASVEAARAAADKIASMAQRAF